MKIGLTYTGTDEKHHNYVRWMQGNERIEIVTLSAKINNFDEIKTCDALILSGGIDIHPKFYQAPLEYHNAPEKGWKEKRDLLEKTLFESALQQSIPILGICRGMQLINVVLKGTLIQDLGDKSLNPVHKGDPDKCHNVNIEEDTLLHDITNIETGKINSAHHQAIEKPGEGLKINCTADDGTVEGLEWADKSGKPFLLCVQWHPERMFKFQLEDSPLSKNIRDKFIEEIIKSKAGK